MTENLKKAKELLPGHSCVFCKEKTVYTCDQSGIAPLLDMLGKDLQGFSVADKVVGKAAAMLYCLMGVKEVYAPVMSQGAIQMLQGHDVEIQFDTAPEAIQNRKGDGLCPMELTVRDLSDPAQAPAALRMTLNKLRGN